MLSSLTEILDNNEKNQGTLVEGYAVGSTERTRLSLHSSWVQNASAITDVIFDSTSEFQKEP